MPRWELRIRRTAEQSGRTRKRTIGTYEVFHDGQRVDDPLLRGTTAEARGPSSNGQSAKEKQRIAVGTYPLAKSDGPEYVTDGYRPDEQIGDGMPGLQLNDTGARSDILIHPGKDAFLSSVGCINLCTALPDEHETIDYRGSRRRVTALIEDIRAFLGANYPAGNSAALPGCSVIIEDAFAQ
jgi:hypothetical protein